MWGSPVARSTAAAESQKSKPKIAAMGEKHLWETSRPVLDCVVAWQRMEDRKHFLVASCLGHGKGSWLHRAAASPSDAATATVREVLPAGRWAAPANHSQSIHPFQGRTNWHHPTCNGSQVMENHTRHCHFHFTPATSKTTASSKVSHHVITHH
jgi:hypothetical protein